MKILFLGDFFFDYNDIPADFGRLCEYVAQNDYKVILNLETAISGYGAPIKKRGPNLASPQSIVSAMKKLNVIAVSMANNHALDFGAEALTRMQELLAEAGIGFFGAGDCRDSAEKPLVIADGEQQIVLHNYGWDVEETVYAEENTPGCAALDAERILNNTRQLRHEYPKAYIVNVYHWGFEFNPLPMPRDMQLAHDSLDAGCNLIIGHHPHVVQPKEQYSGGNIYYSLGNFYFGSRRKGFEKVFEGRTVTNLCDYGIGVICDTHSGECCHLVISYNKRTDESNIETESNYVLEDITGVDYLSEVYVTQVRETAQNYNPILGLNEAENQQAIKRLYKKYALIRLLGQLKNNKIGSALYKHMKKLFKK